eukprot:9516791-Ditylum_brightwellii.AAC.1
MFNIGEDPTDSLFSGGPDGTRWVFVLLHDAIFDKSDNYHYVASTIQILRKSCIEMLFKDGELPNAVLNVDFDELTEKQQKVVCSAMPLKFIYEVDEGGDHNNMHLQNMLAYIAGYFEMGVDKQLASVDVLGICI